MATALRRREQRGAGAQARRVRLPGQTGPPARAHRDLSPRARGEAPRSTGRNLDGREKAAQGDLVARRVERPSAKSCRWSRRSRSRDGHHRAHSGRIGHRQRAGRQPDPSEDARAMPAALHRDQLRFAPREPARERALRLREGRVHRCRSRRSAASSRRPTAGRCSSTRSARCSPGTQAKLLKVLEEMTFRRLGGTRDLKVDVRVIAATNKDLAAEVETRSLSARSLPSARRLSLSPAPAARAPRRHPAPRATSSWRCSPRA